MQCIWKGDLRNTWDAVQLCRIVENLHYWIVRHFRPWVSSCLDSWRRSLEGNYEIGKNGVANAGSYNKGSETSSENEEVDYDIDDMDGSDDREGSEDDEDEDDEEEEEEEEGFDDDEFEEDDSEAENGIENLEMGGTDGEDSQKGVVEKSSSLALKRNGDSELKLLPTLTVKEKKELASYAHSLGKKLKSQLVGKSGVTVNVASSFIETLEANELLKVPISINKVFIFLVFL